MRAIIKFIACLFCVSVMSATAVQAQQHVVVNFNDGKEPLVINQEDILRLDFVFKSSMIENYGINDTIYLAASAGGDYYEGTIRSGEPVNIETKKSWLGASLQLDTINSSSTEFLYNYRFYAEKNSEKTDRVGKVVLRSGSCTKEKIVVQRGYNSSFISSISQRWDEEPVENEVINVEWYNAVAYANFVPNFGVKCVSKPDWVKEVFVSNSDEAVDSIDVANISCFGNINIYFDENYTNAPREGEVVFEDYYGKQLIVSITQGEFNNSNILSALNNLNNNYHYYWGYGSLMHIRDVMTGDMTVVESPYDWYSTWAECRNMGEDRATTQFIWNFYRYLIYEINRNIVVADKVGEEASAVKAVALAYRALAYLDMAQMYEFLPNEVLSSINNAGNDVKNYTVPIITSDVYPYDTLAVPRATREEMAEFILNDLSEAEKYIDKVTDTSKEIPHLDAVYGLKARCYMWLGDYANAKKYARLAIDNNTGHVMTKEECLSTTTGFNNPEPWMWASTLDADDAVVRSGILNWVSWMSPEATFGYSYAGATSMIDAAMYNRISDNDFRKLMFKAPNGHTLESQVSYIDPSRAEHIAEYAAVKFRPNEGNCDTYDVAAATSYPIMRIEEMYFIEAEAAAHIDGDEGVALLGNFMRNYRDENYNAETGNENPVEEIVFQKRVELWGEGLSYYDYKRLNMSVIRGYEGTNVAYNRQFNTNGRPAWLNICIVVTAKRYNPAITGWENPDPSGLYTPVESYE